MSITHYRVRLLDKGNIIHDHIVFSPDESEPDAVYSTLDELECWNWICNPDRSIVITDGSDIDLEPPDHA